MEENSFKKPLKENFQRINSLKFQKEYFGEIPFNASDKSVKDSLGLIRSNS